MSKLLDEGDYIEVKFSNSGYTGPGELLGIAFGSTWLVKVPHGEKTKVISVKAQFIAKATDGLSKLVLQKSEEGSEDEGDDFLTPKEKKRLERKERRKQKRAERD